MQIPKPAPVKLFSNRCGQCRQGAIFSYFLFMNAKCPSCGHRFEKEEGHFIGAMILSYFLTSFLALPGMLIAIFKYDMAFSDVIGFVSLQVLVTGPILYRYSKLAWIHAEERFSASRLNS